jgi:hypothetical protein
MKLIIRANSNCEETNFGCSYAYIDLDLATLQLIQRRFEMIDRLNKEDNSIDRISFVDYGPVWFDPYEDDSERGEALQDKIEALESNADVWLDQDIARSNDFSAEDFENCAARTEADRMKLTERFIWWSCSPKHTNWTAETTLIERQQIYEWLRTLEYNEVQHVGA